MLKLTLCSAALSAVLLTVPVVHAQDKSPSLAPLAWLSGSWQGEAMGGTAVDTYEPEANGEILSTLSAAANGKVTRYEFRRTYVSGGKVIMHQVAWGPDMTPAGEVPDRTLISAGPKLIDFGAVKFERTGENTMTVTLLIPGKDGKPAPVVIRYTRVHAFKN